MRIPQSAHWLNHVLRTRCVPSSASFAHLVAPELSGRAHCAFAFARTARAEANTSRALRIGSRVRFTRPVRFLVYKPCAVCVPNGSLRTARASFSLTHASTSTSPSWRPASLARCYARVKHIACTVHVHLARVRCAWHVECKHIASVRVTRPLFKASGPSNR